MTYRIYNSPYRQTIFWLERWDDGSIVLCAGPERSNEYWPIMAITPTGHKVDCKDINGMALNLAVTEDGEMKQRTPWHWKHGKRFGGNSYD